MDHRIYTGSVSNGKEQGLFRGFNTLKENSLLMLLRKHFTVLENQKVFERRASVIRVLQPAQPDSPLCVSEANSALGLFSLSKGSRE